MNDMFLLVDERVLETKVEKEDLLGGWKTHTPPHKLIT
jgi:hypothetical protein